MQKRLNTHLSEKTSSMEDIESIINFVYNYFKLLIVINAGDFDKYSIKANGLLRHIYSQHIVWKIPDMLRNNKISNTSFKLISTLILLTDLLLEKGEYYYNVFLFNIRREILQFNIFHLKKTKKVKELYMKQCLIILNLQKNIFIIMFYKSIFLIIYSYCDVLNRYNYNSFELNISIAKFINRISNYKIIDNIMDVVFYNISYFVFYYYIYQIIFNKILNDKLFDKKKNKFLIDVIKVVIHNFFDFSKSTPPIYIDLLFWKRSLYEYLLISNKYKEKDRSSNRTHSNDAELDENDDPIYIWNNEEEELLRNKFDVIKDKERDEMYLIIYYQST